MGMYTMPLRQFINSLKKDLTKLFYDKVFVGKTGGRDLSRDRKKLLSEDHTKKR